MLSVPVQLITWEDCPRNDPLCVERDVKQLLAHHSLTHCTQFYFYGMEMM